MKFFVATVLLACFTSILSGCIATNPNNPKFQALYGKELYAKVNSFSTSISWACKSTYNKGSPFCNDQPNYRWTGALIGQHAFGTLHKTGMAIPKAAHVEKGDIIAYHLAPGKPWAVFDRVAAPAADQTENSSCRWDGNLFSSGGVVCNGWRWDKDYPPLDD